MKIFYVRAEPLSAEGPPASAVVVAEDVRRVLGAAATHEIGVYGFTVLGTADSEDPGTPPAAA